MKTPISHQLILKNGHIKPECLNISIPPSCSTPTPTITLRIVNNTLQSSLQSETGRRYIFYFEQLDEETEPLSTGDSHTFKNLQGLRSGHYGITCVNYPKIGCQLVVDNLGNHTDLDEGHKEREIEVQREEDVEGQAERKSGNGSSKISLVGLEAVEERDERDEENKEEFSKDDGERVYSEGEGHDNLLGMPNKAQISDYDRMLQQRSEGDETIQNRYLRYFQQQFKIWRNFFIENPQPSAVAILTPTKQKPKSERKNSEDNQKNSNISVSVDDWSKREKEFYSPDLKNTLSCGSPENYLEKEGFKENFSEAGREGADGAVNRDAKDMSVGLTNSHPEGRCEDEFEKEEKTMKKTNSDKRLAVQPPEQPQKQKDSQTDTGQKQKSPSNSPAVTPQPKPTQSKQASLSEAVPQTPTFLSWLDSEVKGGNIGEVRMLMGERGDEHVIRQWLGHLQNKFRVMKFLYA